MIWRFLFAIFLLMPVPAMAETQALSACSAAIETVERATFLPLGLLQAISRIESGRKLSNASPRVAWPWTVNAEGKGYFFPDKKQAIAAVVAFQQQGIHSIDVGCMQINLRHHQNAFSSLEEAFDPLVNATYAAHFLQMLNHQQHGWFAATAAYHSLTPVLGEDYAQHVFSAWRNGDDTYHAPDFLPQVIMTNVGPRVILPSLKNGPFSTHSVRAFSHLQHSILAAENTPLGSQGRSLAAYRMAPTRLWRQ